MNKNGVHIYIYKIYSHAAMELLMIMIFSARDLVGIFKFVATTDIAFKLKWPKNKCSFGTKESN